MYYHALYLYMYRYLTLTPHFMHKNSRSQVKLKQILANQMF
jgi:hypothetical protein